MSALTESQRKIAISPAEVPEDVLNGVGNKHRFTPAEGLRASAMTPEQQRLLRALVEEYVENADFDAADEQLAAIERAGWDNLSFTWRGAAGDLDRAVLLPGARAALDHRATQHRESRAHRHARSRQ